MRDRTSAAVTGRKSDLRLGTAAVLWSELAIREHPPVGISLGPAAHAKARVGSGPGFP